MPFRVVFIGGTGQVGAAVLRALLAEPSCAEVILVTRKATPHADARVRPVVLDTSTPRFPEDVEALTRSVVALGDAVYGASCVGVGQGSLSWSEEALTALEVGVVGGFARGCRAGGIERFALLSAAGSSAASRMRYPRIMGKKEDAVRAVGFARLALFRPGIIAGNAHTPTALAWVGRLLPGPYGTIDQDDIAGAFVAEFASGAAGTGVASFENGAMRRMARARR